MSQRGVQPGLRAVRELGKTDSGTVVWSIFGGRVADTNNDTDDPKFTGGDGGTGSTDDDTDADADVDDDASGDDKDDKDDKDKDDDRSDWYSPEEYARLRTRMRNSDRNNEKLRLENARLKSAKDKGTKTDDKTDDTSDADRKSPEDVEKERKREERSRKLAMENAFLRASNVDWVDPEDAFRLVDLSDVDVDEDGTVDTKALARALRDLAKRKPHLVKKPQSGSDDTDDDQGPSPKLNGKRKGSSPAPQRKELEKRFPALRQFGSGPR
jgi:hypothetical protein